MSPRTQHQSYGWTFLNGGFCYKFKALGHVVQGIQGIGIDGDTVSSDPVFSAAISRRLPEGQNARGLYGLSEMPSPIREPYAVQSP